MAKLSRTIKKMNWLIEGKVVKLGNDINTDQIIPSKYLTTMDERELAKGCFEGLPEKKYIDDRTILVVGRNFGCGSSREQAVLAIKGCGVKCIIGESFARIFFRNAINNALAVIEKKNITNEIDQGDELEINFKRSEILNLTKKRVYKFIRYPPFIEKIIASGGLIKCLKTKEEQ